MPLRKTVIGQAIIATGVAEIIKPALLQVGSLRIAVNIGLYIFTLFSEGDNHPLNFIWVDAHFPQSFCLLLLSSGPLLLNLQLRF